MFYPEKILNHKKKANNLPAPICLTKVNSTPVFIYTNHQNKRLSKSNSNQLLEFVLVILAAR